MCGIAGSVDFGWSGPNGAALREMSARLAHRGPDEDGTLIDGPCGLAHRRLSIIDLSTSQQPMTLPGGAVSLVYNGELYNYRQLRGELAGAGETFQTRGDTEVVLRSIARDWTGALTKFNGMFALVAWDRERERLLLARDPIGEKPLFYATPRPDLIVFASEPKAVLAHPEVDSAVDADALRQALRFRTVYGARSLYEGVRQVPPGSYVEFSRSGGVRTGTFFDLLDETDAARVRIKGLSDEQLVQRGGELLEDAVRQRLMADVPLGAFLSGGLDSSLVVALMKSLEPGGTVRTFSVGFSGDPFSELHHAKAVAEAIGTDHLEVNVGPEAFVRDLARLSNFRDGPVSEPADVAIAALSRVAKQHVKVVLSGEGADEAFAGYPKYLMARVPDAVRFPLSWVGAERVARLAGWMGLDRRRALVAARSMTLPRERDRIVQWFSYTDRDALRSLLPGLNWTSEQWERTTQEQGDALGRAAHRLTRVGRMQGVDCLSWLPGNMLERGDRMTMAEGLELRPPFLDKRLVAFGLALPDRMKVRGRTTKWIVRQWAARRLPPSIVKRPKWGFKVPLAQWFRAELRDFLFGYLTSSSGLCATYGDAKAIRRSLEMHDRGDVDANLTLWTLLSVEVWYQEAMRSFSPTRDARPAAPLSTAHSVV